MMRIAFFNPQGNFDPFDSYLTEHPDFGGQLVYVKELALAMGKQGVAVDIFTRKIVDQEFRGFESDVDYYRGESSVRIIRIPFGGLRFLPKEKLWSYLPEYVRGVQSFYGEERPDFATSHYGDGGISAALFQEEWGVPYTFTAHSLGAQKLDKMHPTKENVESLNARYAFARRITAEKLAMKNSALNVVSTSQERHLQYGHKYYEDAIDVEDSSRFRVISPGVNMRVFYKELGGQEDKSMQEVFREVVERDIARSRVELPLIVAASRLDGKKNHVGLVRAYALSEKLQAVSNLVITLRGIDNPFMDYSMARPEEKEILEEIMKMVEEYGLRGKVSMFSLSSQGELASFYRVAAERKSVFCLTALYEPFGLAPIEAMACGLPVVVTKNGGPSDVLREGAKEYGVLVDPQSDEDIARGLLHVFCDEGRWETYQEAGFTRVRSRYTWENTAKEYLFWIKDCMEQKKAGREFRVSSVAPFFQQEVFPMEWLF